MIAVSDSMFALTCAVAVVSPVALYLLKLSWQGRAARSSRPGVDRRGVPGPRPGAGPRAVEAAEEFIAEMGENLGLTTQEWLRQQAAADDEEAKRRHQAVGDPEEGIPTVVIDPTRVPPVTQPDGP